MVFPGPPRSYNTGHVHGAVIDREKKEQADKVKKDQADKAKKDQAAADNKK